MQPIQGRLRLVAFVLIAISGILIAQLLSFQFRLDPEVAARLRVNTSGYEGREVEFRPDRGQIYDRDGEILAVNTLEYRIAISPGAVGEDKRETAIELARVLDANELEIYQKLLPDDNGQYPSYVTLKTPVSLAVGQAVDELDIPGIIIEPIPLRDYPQGSLMTQVVGFVNYDLRGYWGVEEYYNVELAGQSRIGTESNIPLDLSEGVELRHGEDIQLTIDRDIQWIAMDVLQQWVTKTQATGGHIIVMNPRTGEILAMASAPYFTADEYNQFSPEERPQFNGTISFAYEPGSIFKIITSAVALDIKKPGLDLSWTYNDLGCEVMGGVDICTSTRQALGIKSFAECLILSLNTCTAHWNQEIGTSLWYDYLRRFGFGTPTGIDLAGEASGIVIWPGNPQWSEANFLQSSFGQGILVTPLQMLTAANAVANDGLMMQPHIVARRFDGERVYEARPTPIGRPISAETAQQILRILVDVVTSINGFDDKAQIEGYSLAGKTGTAQKLGPDFEYSDTISAGSFIGFIPAEDPQLSVIIVLDGLDWNKGYYWGSSTAAPAFAELASRLVVLLEVPPDQVRYDLINAGGHPFDRG
jgi:cell division protein FtsI (penicillin-binding protein 3)